MTTLARMQWASAHSARLDTDAAAGEVSATLREVLGRGPLDLVLAFFSPSHVGSAQTLSSVLRRELEPGCLAGVSAHGVITTSREIETGPALSVVAARLPGVTVSPFIVSQEVWSEQSRDPSGFRTLTPGVEGSEAVLFLADPMSLDVQGVLEAFHSHQPGMRIVGGMASAGQRPGANALVLNDWLAREGGIGIALGGAITVDVAVSQGCRPVGPALEVTRTEGNLVVELDGQSALERTEQILMELGEEDRERLRNGLYVGRPLKTGATGHGDYLIRNLLGADRNRGALAIGDFLRPKERIRLHVRDAASAREDLEMVLSPQVFDARASAALLFSCNGRGQGLYGEPDRDITTLQSALGNEVPAAGMSCAGEIGPVGGRNHVHGHSASIAIVRPKQVRAERSEG